MTVDVDEILAQLRALGAEPFLLKNGSPAIRLSGRVPSSELMAEFVARTDEIVARLRAERATKGRHRAECPYCMGRGWYAAPDARGEPVQVQCEHCEGNGFLPEAPHGGRG